MSSRNATFIVISDSSVLINLSHTGHLSLLGKTPGFEFAVSDEVLAEIVVPEQRAMLEAALSASWIRRVSMSSADELTIFAEASQT